MPNIFSPDSSYKRQARFIAILWTLLILLGCFMPSRSVPKVDVPLIDKWVHFAFFGGFSFFWLCTNPSVKTARLVTISIIAIAFGSLIEILQGAFPSLGRASEFMDAVADSIGALIGIVLFVACSRIFREK
ncbi:hypothetical protein CJD36_007690 [Flavipsychrobacter stenotrophus]|uniref:VanZ-like domain-containing protein n=1 Tax=Flavipsychrobacter stenotrophus TaxID=2077091 RepID=A0A2S7SY93_9BACT|nr:VanZ family protein [Flavipsychrobacter stenotrophus]PQJ11668.1 hypothetical protein CJD36_007690 [Flavipsychrobacter stenotrophus]